MADRTMRPSHADDLAETRAEAFRLLARGVADRRSAFHTPVLASLDAHGAPEARTVVLRGFDGAARTCRLHTDARSAKIPALARDDRAGLHGYEAGGRVQIRLSGRVTIHATDAVAEAAWAATRDFSRLIYGIEPAPGTPVPAPPAAPTEAPDARDNFRVLVLHFDRLEWLWLAAEGHRRALFRWTPTSESATWLVP